MQIVGTDETVYGHADQEGVGQIQSRIDQHQRDTHPGGGLIPGQVGEKTPDEMPIEPSREIFIGYCQTVLTPAILAT